MPFTASVGTAFGVTISGGKGYVTSSSTNLVYTFNPTLGGAVAPVTTTAVPGQAIGIAISGGKGYVTSPSPGVVYTFDTTIVGPIAPFTSGIGAIAFDVAIDGGIGYISAGNGLVYTFNSLAAPGTPATQFTMPTIIFQARGIEIGPLNPLPPSPPSPSISTRGLTDNSLRLATYLNNNAPTSIRLLFRSSTNLNRALKSASPVRNVISTFMAQIGQLSFERVLDTHLGQSNHARTSTVASRWDSNTLLVSNKIRSSQTKSCHRPLFSPWLGVLGEYAREKAQHQTPAFHAASGGVVAACDYYGSLSLNSIGGGAAYAHTHVNQERGAGHADIDQGALTVYGTWIGSNWYCNAALWGGLYHNHNVRHVTVSTVSGNAKSSTHGWQFTPHLEIGYDYIDLLPNIEMNIEPFLMADWVNCWERHLREHGVTGLTMGQKGRYCSLFRVETGFRFQEIMNICWGTLYFREKASYAYQKTFHTGTIHAFLIGSPGFFTVSTLTGAQNLGVAEFEIFFTPHHPQSPYGSLAYQGEFGSHYQSHQLIATIGKDF